jgi:hypothetical protein
MEVVDEDGEVVEERARTAAAYHLTTTREATDGQPRQRHHTGSTGNQGRPRQYGRSGVQG